MRASRAFEPLKEILGPDCEFHVEFVDSIPREAGGKYRICRPEIGVERAADPAYAASGPA